MSIGIANVVGSVGRPTGLETSATVKMPAEQVGPAVPGLENPTGGVVKTERADAVQPTPVSAKAMRVDLVVDDTMSGELPEYPVFGPDKFARVAAEKSQAAAEEDAAQIRADQEQTSDGEADPVVEVSGDRAVEPDARSDRPMTDDAKGAAESVSSAGVPEQPAEASEARLTD